LLSNLIVRPLARVIEGIHSIEKGDFEVQVDSASGDELGRLAAAFNSMAQQLRHFHELNIGEIMAEKRKSETIVRTIDDGIVVVDPEARVTNLNPKAAEILGVTLGDPRGVPFLELWANEEVFFQLKQVLAEGKAPGPGSGENTLTIGKGGERRHYQLAISPIQNRPGRTQGAVLLLRDVTRLKELDQLKSEFIMKASHELKNPLTGLTMNISLLRESSSEHLGQKERQLLGGAEEDLRRLRGLVNDLLDLSRMEAGRLTMEIATASLAAITERCLLALRSQAGQAGIELSAALPDSLPPVLADPNKILWVLTNLVTNALRYTPRGGFVRISAEAEEASVRVEVRDNGQGIPYEDQGRLFEKFFQARGGASGSLGIGLAICKEIVRAHRGAIWLDSAPGKGSAFSFTLPRADRG
jgi:NtrC-family two-component system sensor histidine kinase KinB